MLLQAPAGGAARLSERVLCTRARRGGRRPQLLLPPQVRPVRSAQPTPAILASSLPRRIHRPARRRYHCELNPIERYWGAGKKYARRHCSYTIVGLRECVPIALSQTLAEAPRY